MSIWTAERVEFLRSAWEEGQTAAEIAAALGLTPNSVGGKIYRLQLPKRRKRRSRRVAITGPIPLPDSLRVSILELGLDSCRWPTEEDDRSVEDGRLTFCGHKIAYGYSYCPAHALVAYRAEEKLSRKIDIQMAKAA